MKLPGQRLRAQDADRKVTEFQIPVAVPNRFTALSMPVTDGSGISSSGEKEGRSAADLCNMCSRPLRKRDLQSFFRRVIGC